MAAAYDVEDLTRLLSEQSGVVSRRQLIGLGVEPHDIRRLVRRRDLRPLLPGVYLDHTGEPTWRQRAWAGCLFHAPAALAGPSAVRAAIGPSWRHHDDRAAIHLAVDESRRCSEQEGYRLHRVTGLAPLVAGTASPPRIRLEEAIIDSALARPDRIMRLGILADGCQTGRTTAARLREALDRRTRISDRAWLAGVLTDIGDGTCSTLEHGYLTLVERPHALPRGRRQSPESTTSGRVRRDVDYAPLPVVLELDGRLFHDNARARDRDLDRDLELATTGRASIRVGWGQVFGRPCRTAALVGRVLTRAGWAGGIRACGPDCAAGR